VYKRPFEMNRSDTTSWGEMRQLVDVERYRRELPVLVREFGEVVSARPGHRAVHWEGGGREPIDIEQFPGEFASFRPGQPFEAYVERDQETMQIRRVLLVKRKHALRAQTAADADTFAVSVQSNKDFPRANLD